MTYNYTVTVGDTKSKAREKVAYEIITEILPDWQITPTSDLNTITKEDKEARQDMTAEKNGKTYWIETKTRDCTVEQFYQYGYMVSKEKVDLLSTRSNHAYLVAIYHKSNKIYIWDVNNCNRDGWREDTQITEKNNYTNDKKEDTVYYIPLQTATRVIDWNMEDYEARLCNSWQEYAEKYNVNASAEIIKYKYKFK